MLYGNKYNTIKRSIIMSKFRKVLLVVTLIAVAVTSIALVSACNKDDKDDLPNIESIKATVASGTVFTVGTAFDSTKITVTAKLDNGEERKVETVKAISYDLSVLKLNAEGKFTEAGEYTLPVKYSDWSTTVKIVVTEA